MGVGTSSCKKRLSATPKRIVSFGVNQRLRTVVHPLRQTTQKKQPLTQKGPYRPTGLRFKPGTVLKRDKRLRTVFLKAVEIPEQFKILPDQILPSRDQGQCGSCWAFAITSSIADRVAIMSQGKIKIQLSPQDLVDCVRTESTQGCDGGWPPDGFDYLLKTPVVEESKYPYDAKQNPECKKVDSAYKVKVREVYYITEENTTVGSEKHKANIENIKQTIYQHGPVVAGIKVFPDFMNYDGKTVYEPAPGQTQEGGHAIEIVGWGKNADGVNYWICKNSWGSGWGGGKDIGDPDQRGYFFMKMGINNCGIEDLVFGGIPIYDQTEGDLVECENSSWLSGNSLIILLVIVILAYIVYRKRKHGGK
jgi:cathepsin B